MVILIRRSTNFSSVARVDQIDNAKLSNDDSIDDTFAALVITPPVGENMSVSLAIEYLSDITDTDSMTDELAGIPGYTE